jgi:hypothetical protein
MNHVDLRRHVAAPADEVWAILADQTRWAEWSGFDSIEVLPSSGRAATRLVTSGEVVVRELIRLDAVARRFAYRHLEGLPVQRYAGQITLSPNPGGTMAIWRAQIEPLYFGNNSIVHVLSRVIQQAIDGLAETTETQWRKTGFRVLDGSTASC